MRCKVKQCNGVPAYTYYGRRVCDPCWHKHCAGKLNLKQKFGIKDTN